MCCVEECVCVSVSIHPASSLISARYKSIIFVFKNCHLYQCYVMLGFQMRYYKDHIFLPILFHKCFVIIGSISLSHSFIQDVSSPGVSSPGVSTWLDPLLSDPRSYGGRATDASFKKTIQWMNELKQQGTWWHAPCCFFSFSLMNWLLFYIN